MYIAISVHTQAFPCFSTHVRKIGKAWWIGFCWCNDDVSATISAAVCRDGADMSSLHHQINQAYPIFSCSLINMGRPGYEANSNVIRGRSLLRDVVCFDVWRTSHVVPLFEIFLLAFSLKDLYNTFTFTLYIFCFSLIHLYELCVHVYVCSIL